MINDITTSAAEKLGVAGTQIGGGMAIFGGLTLNDGLAIAVAMAVQTQDAYSKSWTLKADVAAATTIAAVDLIAG